VTCEILTVRVVITITRPSAIKDTYNLMQHITGQTRAYSTALAHKSLLDPY